MNAAILLAGGTGSRTGLTMPKQYILINGRMMITWVLMTMTASSCIDSIYIVAQEEWRGPILEDMKKSGSPVQKIRGFADPGKNRQLSIRNGMNTVVLDISGTEDANRLSDDDTVFIHDAARPFLSGEQIEDCYKALCGHDGVMPVLSMKDTVYMSSDGMRADTILDRSKIYSGQAPELFVLKKYHQANEKLSDEEILKINGSTEPAVMAGMDVVMIPGDERNFKITTDEDLRKCRMIMEERSGRPE